MNFSILQTMRRLLVPLHELSCPKGVWRRLMIDLRHRGHDYHESGAFLLGVVGPGGQRRITDYVLYDDLDPHALDTGIVRLDGRRFGELWDICRARQVTVVADVHTHPYGSRQSESDRAHPIISKAGHIAFIVPRFAVPPVRLSEIGMYRYLGSYTWFNVPEGQRRRFLHLGI
jgi:hypothetical protein